MAALAQQQAPPLEERDLTHVSSTGARVAETAWRVDLKDMT